MSYKTFYNDILQKGVFSPNRFDVDIVLPSVLAKTGYSESLKLRCEAITVITPQLETNVINSGSMKINLPIGRTMEATMMTFVPDRSLSQHHIISKWLDLIVPLDGVHEVGWYNDYIGTIMVTPETTSNKPITPVSYIDAFPFSCSSLEFDKTKKNEIDRFIVGFFYKSIKTTHN
jgi:hypothetical protein